MITRYFFLLFMASAMLNAQPNPNDAARINQFYDTSLLEGMHTLGWITLLIESVVAFRVHLVLSAQWPGQKQN